MNGFTLLEKDKEIEIYKCKFCNGQFIVDKLKQENYGIYDCGCCGEGPKCPYRQTKHYGILEDLSSNYINSICSFCYHQFYSDDSTNSGYAMCGCCGPYPYCPKCYHGSC